MLSRQILSQKTRNEFREYFVGKTLREIRDAFDAVGISCDFDYQPTVQGERRTLVEQYYHTINWSEWSDTRKVVALYQNEIRDLEAPAHLSDYQSEWRQTIAKRLLHWLQIDGFKWVDNRLVHTRQKVVFGDLSATAQKFEWSHLSEQIERMQDAVETDPALAIGTAKELIETVCKTILEERGKPVTGTPDIPTLTKALLKELNLVPDGIKESTRGSDAIKSILRSLGTIGNDLSQLRGLYGTGHGQTAKARGLQPRHAKLAVGAASTFATFVFETHQATIRDIS
jgi:Abortive infection C-terminus